jgi:hypothetical protein
MKHMPCHLAKRYCLPLQPAVDRGLSVILFLLMRDFHCVFVLNKTVHVRNDSYVFQ